MKPIIITLITWKLSQSALRIKSSFLFDRLNLNHFPQNEFTLPDYLSYEHYYFNILIN